jgi:hypothetical protein
MGNDNSIPKIPGPLNPNSDEIDKTTEKVRNNFPGTVITSITIPNITKYWGIRCAKNSITDPNCPKDSFNRAKSQIQAQINQYNNSNSESDPTREDLDEMYDDTYSVTPTTNADGKMESDFEAALLKRNAVAITGFIAIGIFILLCLLFGLSFTSFGYRRKNEQEAFKSACNIAAGSDAGSQIKGFTKSDITARAKDLMKKFPRGMITVKWLFICLIIFGSLFGLISIICMSLGFSILSDGDSLGTYEKVYKVIVDNYQY